MSNELFDASSNHEGSVRDMRISNLLEDHDVASVGIGRIGSASPSKGAFLSPESNGRMLCL